LPGSSRKPALAAGPQAGPRGRHRGAATHHPRCPPVKDRSGGGRNPGPLPRAG
jgi:hypothetical protein